MAAKKPIIGMTEDQRVMPDRLTVDTRPLGTKIIAWLKVPTNMVLLLMLITGGAVLYPSVGDFALLGGLLITPFALVQPETAPLKVPIQAGIPDPNEPNPKTGAPTTGQGIFFLGNDTTSGKELWLTNSDTRQHFLVLGTTGAGKTELLIGFAANALSWGSGLLFCDGKGDVSLFAKMFAMARRFGREDDLLVLNFMTGARDIEGGDGVVLSNTLNPFSTGPSDYLTQMIISLMEETGGDGAMWKGRATAMLSGIVKAAVYLRDRGHLDLNASILSDFMELKRIIALSDPAQYPDLSPEIRTSIRTFLTSLPGYQEEKKEKQAQTTLDQFGFLSMQFAKIFASLSSVYRHIFNTPYGQVDMMDVVLNKRILVVMLPALEKSGDELENLGKIVVANLKGMMGATLGSKIEGNWQRVVDNRVTNSPAPFLCILDEVGYYTVDGLALMAAQARSLGFSMVYASQDIPAMKRRNEKEAASIIANTNTKIWMRTEESKETGALAIDSADKGTRVRIGGFERRVGDAGVNYGIGDGTNFEEINRISFSDLKGQGPGEMHVLFQNSLVRAKAFYADPASSLRKEKLRLRANHFIEIKRPKLSDIELSNQIPMVVERLLNPETWARLQDMAEQAEMEIDDAYINGDEIAIATFVYEKMVSRRRPDLEASCAALGDIISILKDTASSLANAVRPAQDEKIRPAGPPGPFGPDMDDDDELFDPRGPLDAVMGPGERLPKSRTAPPRSTAAPPRRTPQKVNPHVKHEVQIDNKKPTPVVGKPSDNDALLASLAALDFNDGEPPARVEERLNQKLGGQPTAPLPPRPEAISPEDAIEAFGQSAQRIGVKEGPVSTMRAEVPQEQDDEDGAEGNGSMLVQDFLESLISDKTETSDKGEGKKKK